MLRGERFLGHSNTTILWQIFRFDKRKQEEYAITGSADRSIKQWRGKNSHVTKILITLMRPTYNESIAKGSANYTVLGSRTG